MIAYGKGSVWKWKSRSFVELNKTVALDANGEEDANWNMRW